MTHQRRERALAAIKHQQDKPSVALIYAVGAIVESADMSPSGLSSADDVAGMIQAATEDEDIEAIVLRISSPGGSPVASETIRRAIIDAKEEGKIVIVSMGEMAASGGYWIAANADYIYALPGTLTGSIGVAGGKFSLGNMWSKVGVNWASIGFSENADLWSFNQPFSAEGRARFENVIDMIYDAFIARVAEGRGMSVDDAEQVARGRVWSGYQALDVGLVDELGGLNDALDYAGSRLGGEDRHDIRVVMLPSVKTPFERVLQMLEGQVRAGQGLHVLGQYISADDQRQAQALLESLQQSGKINIYQSPLYLR
jgi:protease-4